MIVKTKEGLRLQISWKRRSRPKDQRGFRCTTGTPRSSVDGQGLLKLSMLWALDSKLSSNVIPVILGQSWFSSSSQIRLRQNLLMILKAVAIPLTPILWLTLLALTLSLTVERRHILLKRKILLLQLRSLAYRRVGIFDTDEKKIVGCSIITTSTVHLSYIQSADKIFHWNWQLQDDS